MSSEVKVTRTLSRSERLAKLTISVSLTTDEPYDVALELLDRLFHSALPKKKESPSAAEMRVNGMVGKQFPPQGEGGQKTGQGYDKATNSEMM